MSSALKVPTVTVGIQPNTKLLQLRYEPESQTWILWLYHDRLMQHGTFLRLYTDGTSERVTVNVDGTEEIHRVS